MGIGAIRESPSVGEIADALRRHRERGPVAPETDPQREPVPRREPEPQAPVAKLRPSGDEQHPPIELRTDDVESQNPAIALENNPNAEACRHLALRLRAELDQRSTRSVAIVSSERGDGKTTVACNLAVALSSISRGREVALVDLDLRRPSVANYLCLSSRYGLETVLRDGADLDDVKISVQAPALDVFVAVEAQRSAHELLVLPAFSSLIAELERRYTTVIVDTPPAPVVPDANLILRQVKACVAVVRTGKTRTRSFRRLTDCVPRDRLLGWILNGERSGMRDSDYYYHQDDEREAAADRLRRLRR